jgi:hypothetical protein
VFEDARRVNGASAVLKKLFDAGIGDVDKVDPRP